MRRSRQFWLLCLHVAVLAPQAAADARPAPEHRREVEDAFSPIACADAAQDRPEAAWRAGVFDAQIEGRRLHGVAGMVITAADAQKAAKALARTRRYGSYASGLCPKGGAWAAAFPAPSGMPKPDAQGRLKLPVSALQRHCDSYRIDFADREKGAARELHGPTIDTRALGSGVLSVTCQPRAPRWHGPVLWYLAPVGEGPLADPPHVAALAGQNDPVAALTSWINRVRRDEGLTALEFKNELSTQADLLAIDGSLTHNRELLAKAAARLKERNIRMIGEDRVRASTPVDMAWLLWNSPRHRTLLLDPDANSAGIAARAVGGSHLAVIVTGHSTPLATAKGADSPSGSQGSPESPL